MITRLVPLVVLLGFAGPALAQVSAPPIKPKSTAKSSKGASKPADAKSDKPAEEPVKTEKATFGGGCFWCLEAVFERIPGVKNVVSGYSGGVIANPSYQLVSTGQTGHAEVVQIEYDPAVVSYEKLLDTFWHFHNPTTLNQQGPDFGTQYRSIILYHSEDQKKEAEKMYRALTEARVFDAPIVTELVQFQAFYPADKHHQDYYRKNKRDSYCRIYITPKMKKLDALQAAEKQAVEKPAVEKKKP